MRLIQHNSIISHHIIITTGRISIEEYLQSCVDCVKEAQAVENILRNFRRTFVGMFILLLIICTALFGVSFGVAELSKEVTVSSGARMTVPGSEELVKTGVSGNELTALQPAAPLPDNEDEEEELIDDPPRKDYKLDLGPAIQDINATHPSLFSDLSVNNDNKVGSVDAPKASKKEVVPKSLGCLFPTQVDILEKESFFTGTVIKSPDGTSHVIQIHDLEPKSDGGAVIYDTSGKKYLLTKNDKSCNTVITRDGRRLKSGDGDEMASLVEYNCPNLLAPGEACDSTCLYSCPKGHSCLSS